MPIGKRGPSISVTLAGAEQSLRLTVDDERRWFADGQELEALRGCVDVDLDISPATNTLPIRRLGLQQVRARRSRRPGCCFQPLEIVRASQEYTRSETSTTSTAAQTRHYQLDVDELGLVRNYDQFWVAEAVS